ncbi:ThuA domain-containing protein [Roseiconus lacunae]|uniref:ThuA domain-containing protein n=1 Tax=Roseiconus lacunae TaxID=2605694 RepID=A0ABT7PKT1_9BACT|nr:ThuA domain-containing protein [Roseiconus lacunae]MDM4017073.1 ThuA domain-containing protein [Roseiconus lacunae]WRQ51345.1 ThuA domain-containing protein [Stieleria sp. HD01]
MKHFRLAPLAFALIALVSLDASAQDLNATKATASQSNEAIRVLLITSGCCHDYDFQTKKLQLAFEKHGVPVQWTVVNEGGNGTEAQIDFYKDASWAKNFDVCIHNECFANTTDPAYIRSITQPHYDGLNAVVIHCAMHTYRGAEIDNWRQLLGVTSRRHDHRSAYSVKVTKKDHPIMETFPDGHTIEDDELYIIEKVWPHTTVLATSKSEKTGKDHPVIWTNQYGKARVFGTTYGHSNSTFDDPQFMDLVVRGTTWAAAKR